MQTKHEMLRAYHERHLIVKVCRKFGYSRESFKKALDVFQKEGTAGLVDKLEGKIKPDKVTHKIIGYVIYQRAKFCLPGAQIAKRILEDFGFKLHKRTAEKNLGYYGVSDH